MTAFPHAAVFFSALPSSRAEVLRARPDLHDALTTRLAQARAAWPGVDVDAEKFVAHWARQLAKGADVQTAFDGLHVTDLYLAFACVEGASLALERFKEGPLRAAGSAVRRINANDAFVEEMLVRLFERLMVAEPGRSPRIADYAGAGSLVHWLRAAALRQSLNEQRSIRRSPEVLEDPSAMIGREGSTRDPALQLLKARYRDDFNLAFGHALKQLSTHDRNLLRLHFVEGMSLNQIGAVYRANKSTISRRLLKARQAALQGTRDELGRRLGPVAEDLESMLNSMDSQLELSLRSVLDR